MVLLINEREYSKEYSLKELVKHSDLIKTSRDFASSEEFQQSQDEVSKTIYVHQREFAVLANNDRNGFHLIGSDNATTCHIIVLDNHVAVALAHLDGVATYQSIKNMLQELKRYAPQNTNYDVYLVGGFLDDSRKEYSKSLSDEILNLLSNTTNISYHLKLAAITTYNDHIVNEIHYPLVYGICFDVKTKIIRKMNFIDNGPAFRLRTVYLSTYSEVAWCLYSSLNDAITINKFSITIDIVKHYFQPLYKDYFHDDQKLLMVTSTSPKQEKESYIINMKKTILFILKYYREIPKWFDNEKNSITYHWLDKKWITANTNIIDDVEIT